MHQRNTSKEDGFEKAATSLIYPLLAGSWLSLHPQHAQHLAAPTKLPASDKTITVNALRLCRELVGEGSASLHGSRCMRVLAIMAASAVGRKDVWQYKLTHCIVRAWLPCLLSMSFIANDMPRSCHDYQIGLPY